MEVATITILTALCGAVTVSATDHMGDSGMMVINIYEQGLCPLTYTSPGAHLLLRRFCTGCFNFNER
jgi:hypothetical protein